MADRTFVIGDIHGEINALAALVRSFPKLDGDDTVVLLGDYVDRGPSSGAVIEYIRHELPKQTPAKIVALRGNHEDAWLRVIDHGWPEFLRPPGNGCVATLRSFASYVGDAHAPYTTAEWAKMERGDFFPTDVVTWMSSLPFWYEDRHAIYIHAGLVREHGQWLHPGEVSDPTILLWVRTMDFFKNYVGKRVVVGHTSTKLLPQEFSKFTPDDPTDLWAGESVTAIDTGCGKGGYLTGLELPANRVYESKDRQKIEE